MKRIYPIVFSLFIVASANAQWAQLKQPVFAGKADHKSLIYTGTSVIMLTERTGAVYRSADNGITWDLSLAGLDSNNFSIDYIAYIAARNELWAYSHKNNLQYYKSVNDGVSWTPVSLTPPEGSGMIYGLGRVASRLIAFDEYEWSAPFRNTRLVYSDDGINWKKGGTINTGVEEYYKFHNEHNNIIQGIVVESPGNPTSFCFTDDGGETIKKFPVNGLHPNAQFKDRYFSSDPAGAQMFFIDVGDMKIKKINHGTAEWEVKMNGINLPGYFLAEIISIHSLTNYTLASVLFVKEPVGPGNVKLMLFCSDDAGETWTGIDNPALQLASFNRMIVSAGSGRLIASAEECNLAYSDDNGRTWTPVREIYSGYYESMATLPDGSAFVLSPGNTMGLVKSSDNGNTWIQYNGDLPNFLGIYLIEDIMAGPDNSLYLIGLENPFSDSPSLMRSADGGTHWNPITLASGLSVRNFNFAGRYGDSPVVRFILKDGNEIYRYYNEGTAGWVELSAGVSALGVNQVLGMEGYGSLLLLFAEVESGGRKQIRVFKSENQGSSFTDITSNLDEYWIDILISNRWDWKRSPRPVGSFSNDGQTFAMAVYDYNTYPSSVAIYTLNETMDGWIKMNRGNEIFINSFNIDFFSLIQGGGAWYLSSSRGVYASIDHLSSWHKVWNNKDFINGLAPGSFTVTGNTLLLGSKNVGILGATISPPVIKTNAVTAITENSAKSGGAILSTGGLYFLNKGICWSENSMPNTDDNVVFAGSQQEDFTADLSGLKPATRYFVRAFIQQGTKGTVYGNEESFVTDNSTGIENEKTGGLLLYPNPTNGSFTVESTSEMQMSVIDVLGKEVMAAPVYIGINRFELQSRIPGIYFVKLKGQDKLEKTIRLIVK